LPDELGQAGEREGCNEKAAMKFAKSVFGLRAGMVATPVASCPTKMVNTIFLSRGEFAAPNYALLAMS
jgi:hypothetical protein